MNKKIWMKFFLVYSSYFVVLFILASIFIIKTDDVLVEKTTRITEEMLVKGLEKLDNQLNSYLQSALLLHNNSSIFMLSIEDANMVPRRYNTLEAHRFFSDTSIYGYEKSDYGMILQNGIILTSKRIHMSGDDFYGNYLFCRGFDNYDMWYKYLSGDGESEKNYYLLPENLYVSDNKTYRGLTYVVLLPLNVKKNTMFFATIDSSSITSMLLSSELLSSGNISLTDPNGRLLYMSGNDINSDYITISSTSGNYGLTATVKLDKKIFNTELRMYRTYLFVYTLSFLTFAVLLSLLYSFRSSEPVLDILRAAASDSNLEEIPFNNRHYFKEYKYIIDILHKSGIKIKSFESELEEQKRQMRAHTFIRMLEGTVDANEAEELLRKYFPDIPERFFMMLINMHSDNPANLHNALGMTLSVIKLRFPKCVISVFFNRRIVSLIPASSENSRDERDIVKRMETDLKKMEHVTYKIAVSEIYDDILSINNIYDHLQYMVRMMGDFNTSMAQYQKAEERPDINERLEAVSVLRIYSLLKKPDGQTVKALLDEFLTAVKAEQNRSEDYVKYIFYTYISAIERIRRENQHNAIVDMVLPSYKECSNIKTLFDDLKKCIDTVCMHIEEEKAEKEKSFESMVIEYINRNVFDSELYTKMVTDHFGITVNTLHNIMLKKTGKSFFQYVEQIRMDEAKRLILNTDISIKEVGYKCGFSSANSFYKAFVRKFAISPTRMREARLITGEDTY